MAPIPQGKETVKKEGDHSRLVGGHISLICIGTNTVAQAFEIRKVLRVRLAMRQEARIKSVKLSINQRTAGMPASWAWQDLTSEGSGTWQFMGRWERASAAQISG